MQLERRKSVARKPATRQNRRATRHRSAPVPARYSGGDLPRRRRPSSRQAQHAEGACRNTSRAGENPAGPLRVDAQPHSPPRQETRLLPVGVQKPRGASPGRARHTPPRPHTDDGLEGRRRLQSRSLERSRWSRSRPSSRTVAGGDNCPRQRHCRASRSSPPRRRVLYLSGRISPDASPREPQRRQREFSVFTT